MKGLGVSSAEGTTSPTTTVDVDVDVIIPVHNAEPTILETATSALHQSIPTYLLTGTSTENRYIKNSMIQDNYERHPLKNIHINLAVCCYDDGSTDQSLELLKQLKRDFTTDMKEVDTKDGIGGTISTRLLIGTSTSGIARGAGYARNRAALLRRLCSDDNEEKEVITVKEDDGCQVLHHQNKSNDNYYLCLLDSDDTMHSHRVAHQIAVLLSLPPSHRHVTLLGCTFDRIPADSTWHYTKWANSLTDERLALERYREVTVLQPTWMISAKRFWEIGGYVEAPSPQDATEANGVEFKKVEKKGKNDYPFISSEITSKKNCHSYTLVHPKYDSNETLRLAEDLRFFHAHLLHNHHRYLDHHNQKNYNTQIPPILKLVRTSEPLVSYRHRAGLSQSSSTSRRLLLQLRVKALEDSVLLPKWLSPNAITTDHISSHTDEKISDNGFDRAFVIWGAGRDGKEFFKFLSDDLRKYVRCFVDVDEKKINSGYYMLPSTTTGKDQGNGGGKREAIKVPIVHYSYLARDDQVRERLVKEWINEENEKKKISGIADNSLGRICKKRPHLITQNSSDKSIILKQSLPIDCVGKGNRNDVIKEVVEQNNLFEIERPMQCDMKKEVQFPTFLDSNNKQKQQNKKKSASHRNHIRINKNNLQSQRKLHNISRKDKSNILMLKNLKKCPVVVCVAMYRTNGVLEKNVESIGRREGVDLWHFS